MVKALTGRHYKRFFSHVKKGKCWEWTAYVCPTGYAIFRSGGKMEYVHRLSYATHVGKIPKGLCVCHKCDNRKCVRPSHLFIGTNADNLADMRRKGRWRARPARGEDNAMAKLTEKNVRHIRNNYEVGVVSGAELARKFGVSKGLIFSILHRRAWAHIA